MIGRPFDFRRYASAVRGRLRAPSEPDVKIDPDYTKRLLQAFQDAPRPYLMPSELLSLDPPMPNNDELLLHVRALADSGAIENNVKGQPIGIEGRALDGSGGRLVEHALRMTSRGDEVLAALRSPTFGARVRDRFLSEGANLAIAYARRLVWEQFGMTVDE